YQHERGHARWCQNYHREPRAHWPERAIVYRFSFCGLPKSPTLGNVL
ncbi:bacterial transferase hexapeptide family protein, partial [Vibrio parahaemolyticus V-223/04]